MNEYVIDSDRAALSARPLGADENAFRVTDRLGEAAYRHLASRLAERPDAWLHLWDGAPDLEALEYFAGLRRLMVTNLSLQRWDGLRHVADSLEAVAMGDTTMRPLSIAPMGQLHVLRELGLVGPVRDVEVIGGLQGITDLSLRSVTLPDLRLLLPMRGLRALWIGLGGTADLGLLPKLAELEEVELWRIRGLEDISMLPAVPRLRSVTLQSMSSITQLPSFRDASFLRRVALDTMKGITDLSPLAEAPALEELLLIAMPQIDADALRPFVGHPTLRRGIWGLGSTRKNIAAYELLPLGEPPYGHPDWTASIEGRKRNEPSG